MGRGRRRRGPHPGPPHGLVLLHKPAGPTSAGVLREVQRRLGGVKLGHAGTLDPGATGLLVALAGEGTKLAPWIVGADKVYVAAVALGRTTDTLDAAGEVVDTADIPDDALDPSRIQQALAEHVGTVEQVPPVISALKVGGRTMMSRARAGEEVVPEPRTVRCHELELLGVDADRAELELRIRCGSGYYVRSLARDLAATLGTLGHLSALHRERVGPWSADEAFAPDEVTEADVIPLALALPEVPTLELEAEAAKHLRDGRSIPAPPGIERAIALGPEGRPLAMVEVSEGGRLTVRRGFRIDD